MQASILCGQSFPSSFGTKHKQTPKQSISLILKGQSSISFHQLAGTIRVPHPQVGKQRYDPTKHPHKDKVLTSKPPSTIFARHRRFHGLHLWQVFHGFGNFCQIETEQIFGVVGVETSFETRDGNQRLRVCRNCFSSQENSIVSDNHLIISEIIFEAQEERRCHFCSTVAKYPCQRLQYEPWSLRCFASGNLKLQVFEKLSRKAFIHSWITWEKKKWIHLDTNFGVSFNPKDQLNLISK